MKKLITLAVAMLVAVSAQARQGDDIPTPPHSMWIEDDRLIKLYDDNEVYADSGYRGKWLEMFATVRSIRETFAGDIVLELATDTRLSPIRAYLQDGYEAQAAKLKKGQTIVLDCVGGGMVLGSPVLRRCVIPQ
ncbi:OB-fold protein [Paraburkholderia sediminicola]|uniref:OB-fold protein n=1 Tax=Paraburkholderia sediminicola TaxID=458836 RepID=UPI0038BA0F65